MVGFQLMGTIKWCCRNVIYILTNKLLSTFARTVELLINMQYLSVSQRNVPATMEIIQFVIVNNATTSDITTDGVVTTLYTLAYLSSGIWMQRCRHTWWSQLSGIASRIFKMYNLYIIIISPTWPWILNIEHHEKIPYRKDKYRWYDSIGMQWCKLNWLILGFIYRMPPSTIFFICLF
jgi:hypothetical protein